MTRRRILLLVPHPDDEVVGCAVAARRAIAAGADLFTIYLTTGVPSRDALWPWQRAGRAARVAHRRTEAERAAALLGVRPVAFLDWPSRMLKAHIEEAIAAIGSAIGRHAIDLLWTPAFEGAHQDHDVANFLASRLAPLCPAIEFAEYHFHGGRARSGEFFDADGSERMLALSAEEAAWKRRLLAVYASERGNLAHIACVTEALRPLRPHDYTCRPHRGTLFYERFQWVPFRHPRIDFDAPEIVSAAMAAHLAACAAETRRVRDAACAPDSHA